MIFRFEDYSITNSRNFTTLVKYKYSKYPIEMPIDEWFSPEEEKRCGN